MGRGGWVRDGSARVWGRGVRRVGCCAVLFSWDPAAPLCVRLVTGAVRHRADGVCRNSAGAAAASVFTACPALPCLPCSKMKVVHKYAYKHTVNEVTFSGDSKLLFQASGSGGWVVGGLGGCCLVWMCVCGRSAALSAWVPLLRPTWCPPSLTHSIDPPPPPPTPTRTPLPPPRRRG